MTQREFNIVMSEHFCTLGMLVWGMWPFMPALRQISFIYSNASIYGYYYSLHDIFMGLTVTLSQVLRWRVPVETLAARFTLWANASSQCGPLNVTL